MAIITMPNDLACGRGCRVELITVDATGTSDPAGNSQAREYGMPKWALSLTAHELLTDAEAGAWKAMLLGLRGSVNYLAAFDPSRPYPVGSLRGSPTLQSAAAYGATDLTLNCGVEQAGRTVRIGDWIQIGTGLGTSQTVMCMADATVDAGGLLVLHFMNPLRRGFDASTPVAWDRARTYYRKPPGRVGWTPYSFTFSQAIGVDLVEAWP